MKISDLSQEELQELWNALQKNSPEKKKKKIRTVTVSCNLCGTPQVISLKCYTSEELLKRIKIFWCNSCEDTLAELSPEDLAWKLVEMAKKLWPSMKID